MKNKKFYKKDLLILMGIIPISFVGKIFQIKFLAHLTSTDSSYILSLMSHNIERKGTAFYVTAELFKKINILKLSTLNEWAIILSGIFTIVLLKILLKNKKYSIKEAIFIYISVILLNLYTFNLSKDIIQFVIFTMLYIILLNRKLNTKIKVIFVIGILVLEALFFRSYYIIIAYGFILTYFLLQKYFIKAKKKDLNKKNIFKIVILMLFIFLLPIGLTKTIIPAQYNKIVNVRDEVTAILEANTEINNLVNGNNFFIFVINYIINGVRIFFPLELIVKGMKYLPFVIYQLYVTCFIIIKHLKKINRNNVLVLSIVLGYFLGTIIFEPDFGSVVRHEITLSLFFIYLNHIVSKGEDNFNEGFTNRNNL